MIDLKGSVLSNFLLDFQSMPKLFFVNLVLKLQMYLIKILKIILKIFLLVKLF